MNTNESTAEELLTRLEKQVKYGTKVVLDTDEAIKLISAARRGLEAVPDSFIQAMIEVEQMKQKELETQLANLAQLKAQADDLIKELRKDKERLERLKPFIEQWTLKIQKHRELKPEQLDYIFQALYHWYCELGVEGRQAIDDAVEKEGK